MYKEGFSLRKWYRWFMAYYRLDLNIVCEESVGKELWNDYHDYPDDKSGLPEHSAILKCKRCGKEFTI